MSSSETPPALPEESERRQATILFADISGFTAMSEKMDPELVTALMNECFRMLGAVVERNGGIIDKFIGDCIMVLFGVPKALEDSPRRAVQTALEMRDTLHETRRSRSVEAELDIHIGINSGEVISGRIGAEQKREYTVMGDAVNLASHLKDAAPRGAIYVGPQTWRQTRDGYEYRCGEPIPLKGKENPVPIYELLSPRAGGGHGRMVFSPLVSRKPELDLLERRVLRAVNGEGSIVHLVGEAGIGKSRLTAELRARECMQQVTLLEGRAQSFGKNLSFHPVIDLLKKWAVIGDEEDEAESLRKLELAIRLVSPEKAEETLPFIATLMGMRLTRASAERLQGIAGDALTKLIFRNALDLLSRAAQRRPLVIVLEDMHWADESTIEFVEYLFTMVERERVLFLNVFRPREEMAERLTRTARERHGARYQEILLRPLTGEDCVQLVCNLLRTNAVPPAVVGSLAARAGGNPFFIEEIVRAWIDEQAVEVGKEGFRVTEKIGSFVIPETVTEVIMTRFDRLDREAREVLRVAAVIGRSFFYRILALVARKVGSIDKKIALLTDAQIILERLGMEEVEYQFKHALAQEAIYESILQQIRKELHLNVARAIESIFAGRLGEFAGMLALHYSRGDDFEKAEHYMILAGEEALRSGASREGINHYRDALELYRSRRGRAADPAKVAMLETSIARSLFYKGWYAEALPYYDRLQNHYGVFVPRGRGAARLSAALALLRILVWLYMPERPSRTPLTPALREGFELSLEKGRMLTNYEQRSFVIHSSTVLRQLLKYDVRDFEPGLIILSAASAVFLVPGTSIAVSRRILEKTKRVIRPELPRAYLFHLAVTLVHSYYAGEWGNRDGFRDPLVQMQIGWESLWDIGCILWTTCNICTEAGDWARYHDALRILEDTLKRFPSDFDRQYVFLVRARYHMKRREAGGMASAVADLMGLLTANGFDVSPALSLSSRAALIRGDFEAAVHDSERVTARAAKSTGSIFVDGILLMAHGAVAVEKARRASAEGKLDQAQRRACLTALRAYAKNARKFTPDRAESLRFLGSYWWYAGSRRRALALWKQSIRESERLGARVDLAHTFADAGGLLGDAGPGPAWRARGVELYRALGMSAD